MEDDEMSIFNMIQTLNQKNYRQTFFKFAKKNSWKPCSQAKPVTRAFQIRDKSQVQNQSKDYYLTNGTTMKCQFSVWYERKLDWIKKIPGKFLKFAYKLVKTLQSSKTSHARCSVQLSSKVCCHRRCTAVQRVFSRCAAQLRLISGAPA